MERRQRRGSVPPGPQPTDGHRGRQRGLEVRPQDGGRRVSSKTRRKQSADIPHFQVSRQVVIVLASPAPRPSDLGGGSVLVETRCQLGQWCEKTPEYYERPS